MRTSTTFGISAGRGKLRHGTLRFDRLDIGDLDDRGLKTAAAQMLDPCRATPTVRIFPDRDGRQGAGKGLPRRKENATAGEKADECPLADICRMSIDGAIPFLELGMRH